MRSYTAPLLCLALATVNAAFDEYNLRLAFSYLDSDSRGDPGHGKISEREIEAGYVANHLVEFFMVYDDDRNGEPDLELDELKVTFSDGIATQIMDTFDDDKSEHLTIDELGYPGKVAWLAGFVIENWKELTAGSQHVTFDAVKKKLEGGKKHHRGSAYAVEHSPFTRATVSANSTEGDDPISDPDELMFNEETVVALFKRLDESHTGDGINLNQLKAIISAPLVHSLYPLLNDKQEAKKKHHSKGAPAAADDDSDGLDQEELEEILDRDVAEEMMVLDGGAKASASSDKDKKGGGGGGVEGADNELQMAELEIKYSVVKLAGELAERTGYKQQWTFKQAREWVRNWRKEIQEGEENEEDDDGDIHHHRGKNSKAKAVAFAKKGNTSANEYFASRANM